MDQKTTYEITITEKLGQVTIPDMSEMIWSRIEAELDLDPGDIDGGDTPPPATPPVRIIFGGVVLLFIGALFIYFLNSKNTDKDNSNQLPSTERSNTQTTVTTQPPGSDAAGDQPVILNGELQQTPGTNTNDQTGDDSTNNGGLATAPIIIPPANDTSLQTANADPGIVIANPPPPAKKDSLPPQKKRGVGGISPGDYKIVPKKDSTR